MIYLITTFAISSLPNSNTYNELVRYRTVGFFDSKKDAFKILYGNCWDLWEAGYYPYAVIEEVKEGLYLPSISHWFFEYDREKDGYIETEELWEPLVSFLG